MKKRLPLFTRIFAYIMLLLLLMSLGGGALFARQFLSFYRSEQFRQLSGVFQPMIGEFEGKTPAEITEIARAFYSKNQSFDFIIEGKNGNVLFSTPGATEKVLFEDGAARRNRVIIQYSRLPEEAYTVRGVNLTAPTVNYGNLAGRLLVALGIMIALGALGALLFARKFTKPLEDELARERVMEENQRLFFSAASHELKTPIAATEAMIEGMIANIGDYKAHQKYLRECLKTLDSQNRLVSEILEIVKLSDEKAEVLFRPLDLAEIVNALTAEYRPLAEQRGLEIQLEIPPPASLTVRAGRNLLYRALSNALANAVQNTPAGGTIRVTAAEQQGGKVAGQGVVRLLVLNTGAQIPQELLSRLFAPFYRLDLARNRSEGRSGLGLTIVKKSLERMGIPFGLENTGEGVRFWMELEQIIVEPVPKRKP
jgi:two-component system sensor histidine kinase VanS